MQLPRLLRRLFSLATLLSIPFLTASCDKPSEAALAKLEKEGFKFTAEDFIRASGSGDEENLENFITAGVDVNAKNPADYTALMTAAERGQITTITRLLDAGASPDIQGKDGWTALMLAAFGNQVPVVQTLVDRGADVDLRDNNGWTALMQAVYQGHDRVVQCLATKSHDGLDRALLVAALMGHDKVLSLLLDAGADINSATEDGETPLMLAAQKGRMETVHLLVARGAHRLPKNNIGQSAEATATANGHADIATFLAESLAARPDPTPTPTPAPEIATTVPTEVPTPAAPVAEPTSVPLPAATPAAVTTEQTQPLPDKTTPSASVAAPSEEEWFKKHNLDLSDSAMLTADPDADGFSNRDEYLSDTDPHNASSAPPRAVRLRLSKTNEGRLPIILESVSGTRATIRRVNSGDTVTVSTGEAVPGTSFTVESVRKRAHTDKTSDGKLSDVSEATLKNSQDGEKVTLVRGLSTRGRGSNAELYLEGEGRTIQVRPSEEFSLPNDNNRRYQVVDIRPTQVVLRENASGTVFTVTKE